MSESAEPLLSLDGIGRRYGEKWGLLPLTINIEDGDFLAVLGPNGAGKSTLLKLMSQQSKPSEGKIRYRGRLAKELGSSYRGKIGVISHNPFLYSALSAFENLIFYANLYSIKNSEEKALELLHRVDMGKRMYDPVRMYSRGMVQRTSIARALLNDPEIIFLDEPYTGLDRQASYMLTDILREQVKRNVTVILVTHDLLLGYELANKILILSKGQKKYFGSSDIPPSEFEQFYLSSVE